MVEAAPNSINGSKKQKLDENEKQKQWPPAYGSQEYWEERYQKNRRLEENGGKAEADSDNDALPYHPWYFTYKELSPLILPLILGGREEGVDLMGGCRKDDVEECKSDETVEDGEEVHDSERVETNIQNDDNSESSICDRSSLNAEDGEESEHSYAEGDDQEEEETEEREGLAKHGPISVIEIGCGDMPLGRDLSLELGKLEETTGAKADNIVKEIVCCDYSSTVIELCKENQRKYLAQLLGGSDNSPSSSMNSNFIVVDYVIADGRKLPYPDGSFHLIMEKGTLDAMLSDKETGASNCTLIIAECARVLKEGGEC